MLNQKLLITNDVLNSVPNNLTDSDTVSSGFGNSTSETSRANENSLIPNESLNVNHLSRITNNPHFNEFLERYEHSNTFSNPNSTEWGLLLIQITYNHSLTMTLLTR